MEENVAKKEEAILEFWQKNKIFEQSLAKDSPQGEFVFYDGPPFANGLPHYGHILAGTIKDVIPRYKTMQGYHVPRRWGWDCHGLPVENVVEKELGLKAKKDIIDYGIDKFNDKAKASVLHYADDWRQIIPRLGRWVDMDDDYKTMDWSYTETIWWIFKTLHDKNLIYEGYKPMQLCPRCETTLANFEVNQGYKDVTDLAVTAKFELVDEPGTYLLAWTTTPWTLPGNVALAVNQAINYSKVSFEDSNYILATERLESVFKDKPYEMVTEMAGVDLIGQKYTPVFDYYINDQTLKNRENGWQVHGADFVTTDEGTGIVHIAPAFGEDDYYLSEVNKLPFIQHVGTNGRFKPEVTDFAGELVKDKDDPQAMDIKIIKYLAAKNLLFAKEKIVHSYPHCWRCETPLLNYAASSWFVKVTSFKDKLLAANNTVNWIPANIKTGRFGKWLEGARDWAISRSRFWGAPLPVWKCDTCKETTILGSIEDLRTKTKTITKIILVRHGESEKNVKGIYDSSLDGFPLTKQGREQATLAAETLVKEKIDIIVSSPVRRAKETAEVIASKLGWSVDFSDSLKEGFEGEWEGKTEPEVKALPSHQAYQTGDFNYRYETKRGVTGESWQEIEKRAADYVRDLITKHQGQTIVLVTHQGVVASLYKALFNLSVADTARLYDHRFSAYSQPFTFYVDAATGQGFDFHRPFIDNFVFSCACGGHMKRIADVFDCWFESGSMPYGQAHYPFATKNFDPDKSVGFPAQFIAEGVDQTRGWFYSSLVLGTALFGASPYRAVIVNGLILAGDGQKMSKRLQNYPDPLEVVNKYGADALRLFLLGSPVVRGEEVRFSEEGVGEVYRKVIARLQNVLTFYQTYGGPLSTGEELKTTNILDYWMVARLAETNNATTKALDNYELDRAVRPIADLIEDLSIWYLRRSRDRFKSADMADRQAAIDTTAYVLRGIAALLAPLAPFMAETIYQAFPEAGLPASVHLTNWPNLKPLPKTPKDIIEQMAVAREAVSAALEARAKANIKVRQPLARLTIKQKIASEYLKLIADEVNVLEVIVDEKLATEITLDLNLTPELKEAGEVRELMRLIQDARRDAGSTPGELVKIEVPVIYEKLVANHEAELKQACFLSSIKVSAVETVTIDH